MRLHFPNKEHDDVLIAQGETSLGSAADNLIVLTGSGIAPHHAALAVGDRGIVLTIADPHARTHVNARPVREKAILRLGDVVSLDTLQFVLKPDRDDAIRTDIPQHATPLPPTSLSTDSGEQATRTRMAPPKAVLRGVSGTYFGKIVPVRSRLVIGRGSDCDLVLDEPEMSRRHAMIENTGDCIYLRDLGSSNGTFVNGVQVRDAILYPDDQIAFDRNRFLLEAPGLPGRHEVPVPDRNAPDITQTMQAVRLPAGHKPAEPANPNKNDIWWLIAAAALIGIGIAVLLLVKF
ncbi:MAG TPA: FHA domain-containing protein [Rudaea sp.]